MRQKKPNFYSIFPCTKDILYAWFEDFITFLYIFMNVVKVFVRWELWANVPVAIFFPTKDCGDHMEVIFVWVDELFLEW